MSFSITITADTLEGVKAQALAFAGAPAVVVEKQAVRGKKVDPLPVIDPAALSPAQKDAVEKGDTVALSPAQVKGLVDAAETPPPKVETPASTGPDTTTGAAASTGTSPTTAELEEKVRAILTPLLRDPDQAGKVSALMAKFGATKLSKIPTDKLPEVLAAAEAL